MVPLSLKVRDLFLNKRDMSKEKKARRAAAKAKREALQGKKVVYWVVGALIILTVLCLVGYSLM